MEKQKLFVTISGLSASGKSRLTYLLNNFLSKEGFDVEQELNIDHPTIVNFNSVMGENFDKAINNIKSTRKIIIRERQLYHDCGENKLKELKEY
jgi:uridine kinase